MATAKKSEPHIPPLGNDGTPGKEYSRYLDLHLGELDPAVQSIIDFEAERQREKLILIASESICPLPVREALSSELSNIYAEGYPGERMLHSKEEKLADYSDQLSYYRRHANDRYYKGCEYADLVESLAIRRAAKIFATPDFPPDKIFVNVQPLSGAAANNAVYDAFVKPGQTVMGMTLAHGGHLTHGSPVNRSGKNYRIISYGIHQDTGRIDYNEIEELARIHRVRMIIAGYSAYPWHVDWARFREIADSVGAILMADMSHYAGLVVAGDYPSPIGYADVTTLTTHKTLCGPRGAVILTTDVEKARAIDFSVFPGEQGGPHINSIAARAVSFKIAATAEFRNLQHRIVANCKALVAGLEKRGLCVAYGGTETHLCLVDLRSVDTMADAPLRGEMASRLLDLCGITCNKNTIAGDTSAVEPNGIRLGTAWITQRGLGLAEMDSLAGLIHQALTSICPYTVSGPGGFLRYGAKMALEDIESVQQGVAALVDRAIAGSEAPLFGYPHYSPAGRSTRNSAAISEEFCVFRIRGERAWVFLQSAVSCSLSGIQPGQVRKGKLLGAGGEELDTVEIACENGNGFLLQASGAHADQVHRWLSLLSDGYVLIDKNDLARTLDGPVMIERQHGRPLESSAEPRVDETKPFFIGQPISSTGQHSHVSFDFTEDEGQLRRTCLYEVHTRLTSSNRIIPFGGWEMPVCYDATSIAAEHEAVRNAAALFDVTHMGILEFSGLGAERFLDLVTTNEVPPLSIGRVQYSYLLAPDGQVLDDITLYRLSENRFMMVVNASNAEKVEAWLRGVNEQKWILDEDLPAKQVDATATIRNLKSPSAGKDQRVDLALQGPHASAVIERMLQDSADRKRLRRLGRFAFFQTNLGGTDAIIATTGYTGEPAGFELYLHPEDAVDLWHKLLEAGHDLGAIPAGLGARDSARIEAGFPLYGHELAGPCSVSPLEAGYGYFVKLNKPWFVGRTAMVAHRDSWTHQVVRFKVTTKPARAVRAEDPIQDADGHEIGTVTSCTRIGDTQMGLAYVGRELRRSGTRLTIVPRPRTKREEGRKVSPIEAKVIRRFWKKK